MRDLTVPEQKEIWDRRNANESFRDLAPDPRVLHYIGDLPQQSRRALDLGCGNGRHLLQLAEIGWRCTGIDWSTEALVQTRQALSGFEQTTSVLNGDFRRTTFSGNYFHLILAIDVIHHGKRRDLERAIAEIKRIKAISGDVLVSLPGMRNAPAEHQADWIEEQTVVLRNGLEVGIPHHFIKEEDIGKLFRTFRKISAERVVLPMPPGVEPLHSMHENEWYWIRLSG
ncbi:class I SAM-dependent methyltransferase [bacterium]|nr:class I SAM-dependent methyltransferase [bacterium]